MGDFLFGLVVRCGEQNKQTKMKVKHQMTFFLREPEGDSRRFTDNDGVPQGHKVTKLELPKAYCFFQKRSPGVLLRTKREL